MGGNLGQQVANFHVLVKLIDAFLFLPIVRHFAKFIEWFVPDKMAKKPAMDTPQYLDDRFVREPVVAVELAIKEIIRLGNISRNMVKHAMDGVMYNDERLLDKVEGFRKAVAKLRTAIFDYIIKISEQDLSREDRERLPKLIMSLNNFDRVAGHAVRLLELGRTKVAKNIPLVGAALKELKAVYREVDTMLTEVSAFLPQFKR